MEGMGNASCIRMTKIALSVITNPGYNEHILSVPWSLL